ncbi:hypothetical protein Y919_04450 [Caloranaerobacter azorensis H53214]|uniref:UPF0102 protein SAMN02745135_00284 n=2 Tax=Caloranaerobacter azorensis TaxID=116090 RepID=A0A1M5RNS7_9FIRM|nr:YraN family protein [Caloranaerobacter azorensis]KGG80770.1 hypothetical protein Y919_04450 [Caloranaerobacter azorensis H53214]SHH27780.1 putative endonuclease [Caloranaerobacter azorensis DSM 13643]
MKSKITGIIGEKLAVNYLIKNNYKIIERNFKCKLGEIDIIAVIDDIIVFIEVKTRRNSNYGYPYEAVTVDKQQKIIKTAYSYIKLKKIVNKQYRFDIIEIFLGKDIKINHIQNAFWI